MIKKMFIYCPAKSYTGGPTLSHQFCFMLRQKGINAFMWYDCNPIKKFFIDPVHDNYKKFDNPYTIKYPKDEKDIVIVALESNVSILRHYKKAKKYIWWMSVDNYFLNMGSVLDVIRKRFFYFKPTYEYCITYAEAPRYSINDSSITHLVQSEYARLFLIGKGISSSKIFDLGDYLEEEILNVRVDPSTVRSDNVILYNPKKGFEFTSLIIQSAPQYNWVPLIDMSKEQVKEKLLTSKLYIDFGNHPGKDRFPREAVMCGCCIITGRRGAANNDMDIAIPQKYKFNDQLESIPAIIERISEILESYSSVCHDFDEYRRKIMGEKEEFNRQIESLFSF